MKTILLIVITLLATFAGGLSLVPAYAVDTSSHAAKTLLGVLEHTHSKVVALFDSSYTDEEQVPDEVEEQLQTAVQLQEQAQTFFKNGEYHKCIDKATEALNAYGKAIAELNERIEENHNEAEENYALFAAVERAMEHLAKLREIASYLESIGIDVTEATHLLDKAETSLVSAEVSLNTGGFDEADDFLSEARSLMVQATGKLQSMSKPRKIQKIEQFIDQMQSRLRHLQETMFKILNKYGVSEEDTQSLSEEFQSIESAIGEMDVNEDDLDKAINKLKYIIKESQRIGKDHEKLEEKTVEKLYDASKLEAKLDRCRERIRELEKLGHEIDELKGLLLEAEGLLNEVTINLGEGDRETAGDLIEQVDDLLDDIDDLIDEKEEEAEEHDHTHPGGR